MTPIMHPLVGVTIDPAEQKMGMCVPLREYDTFESALRHCLTNLQFVLLTSVCESGQPLGSSKAVGIIRNRHLVIGCDIRCNH